MLGCVDLPPVALVSLVEGGEHLLVESLAVFHPRSFFRADGLMNGFEQELLGEDDVGGVGRAKLAFAPRDFASRA